LVTLPQSRRDRGRLRLIRQAATAPGPSRGVPRPGWARRPARRTGSRRCRRRHSARREPPRRQALLDAGVPDAEFEADLDDLVTLVKSLAGPL